MERKRNAALWWTDVIRSDVFHDLPVLQLSQTQPIFISLRFLMSTGRVVDRKEKSLLWCFSHATVLAIKTLVQNHFKHAEGICGSAWQEENVPCRNLLNCVCSLGKTLVRLSDKAWWAHVIKIGEIWHTHSFRPAGCSFFTDWQQCSRNGFK